MSERDKALDVSQTQSNKIHTTNWKKEPYDAFWNDHFKLFTDRFCIFSSPSLFLKLLFVPFWNNFSHDITIKHEILLKRVSYIFCSYDGTIYVQNFFFKCSFALMHDTL